MIVTLLGVKSISSITLPEKVRGKFYLKSEDGTYVFSIEAVEERWLLKSNGDQSFYDDNGILQKEIWLCPMQVYPISEDDAVLYVEPDTLNRKQYSKTRLFQEEEITIGRNQGNTIVYNNSFVSNIHAVITWVDGKWIVSDYHSKNGTFLNGRAIDEEILQYGDVIYLMGLKIVFGKNFLALNNPDGKVEIKNEKENLTIPMQAKKTDRKILDFSEECFFQSPRFKRDIPERKIKIDAPPGNDMKDDTPMALVLGPSVTMGLASMTSGIFTINNALNNGQTSSAISSGIMCGSMLLGCILWPVLSRSFERNRKKKKEALRQQKYGEYLKEKEREIQEICSEEQEILRENFRTADDYIERIQQKKRNLWERSTNHNDFLQFRIGFGDLPFMSEIVYPENVFSIEEDNLKDAMYRICEQPHTLKNVPIVISLFDEYCSGIIGEKNSIRNLAIQIIIQIISSYSYEDVKLVFLLEEDDKQLYDFVKWLPHTWTDDRELRMIAANLEDLKHVAAVMGKEIESRLDLTDAEQEEQHPYYILFSFNRRLETHMDLLERVREKKKNIGFSTVSIYERISDLPKECTMVAELSGDSGKLYSQKDLSGKQTVFRMDGKIDCDLHQLGVKLANIPLAVKEGTYQLPSVLTFLQMFGAGKIEHLNSLVRWKENNPVKSLETPIGVDTFGELFQLDLHQNAHGPHGLVAGMTGSGKSEFIMTYILSLAVNFHPDEVAFVLIDYKGGGMAKSFADLPHTAGIITNLDGAAINRSLASIESELKYREEIFAEVGLREGISNLDIYKYQRLYRENVVTIPMPHLFIISDEFAELKTQQPEFMTQLVSAARIGRSLGVHLILATQKPSGVVDDQIWSNSRFRICLKVQEKADSMDMLKRHEAAELKDTGRFYLQVGYNELFKMGQSAWAGALYDPQDKVEEEKDDGIQVIDTTGNVLKSVALDRRKTFGKPTKQLDAIVRYLKKIAEEENIHVKALWLEPMAEVILLRELYTKYNVDRKEPYLLHPVIGEYDKPTSQKEKRGLLRLPLTENGNALIYGAAGSGKEQFLTTMIYSLLEEHTAEQVNLYLLDFGSETLQAFAQAPQVGDVVFSTEREKIANLFKMLQIILNDRKKVLTNYGGGFWEYEQETEHPLPSIVVVINNYAVFSETYEDMEDILTYFTREGMKYGIYFVVTAIALNDVRIRLRNNFSQQLVMNMNDETDYAAVFGNIGGLCPTHCKGRGLVKLDEVYEFQTASVTEQAASAVYIRCECEKMGKSWGGKRAKRIPVLPEKVDAVCMKEYLPEMNDMELPVGIDSQNLEPAVYSLASSYISLILGSGDSYMNFTGNLIRLLEIRNWKVSVLDIDGKLKESAGGCRGYFMGRQNCEQEIEKLFALVRDRNNEYKTALEEKRKPESYPIQVILISSIHALKEGIGNVQQEMLELILLKGAIDYHVFAVIAESAAHIAGYAYANWFKANVRADYGIWTGSGFRDQYQFKASRIIGGKRNEEEEEDFGYVLKKGKAYKTKLMYTWEEENE